MAKRKSPKKRVTNFEKAIVKIVSEKEIPYVEAVLEYCENNEVDPTHIKNLITPKIKEKLEDEFDDLVH